MAWNQSSPSTPAKSSTRRPSIRLHGILAGALVIVGFVVFFLWRSDDTPQPATVKTARAKRIASAVPVVPAVQPTTPAASPKVGPKATFKERYKAMWGDKPMNKARLAQVSCDTKGIEFRSVVGTNATYETRLVRYRNRLHQELVKYVHPGRFCDTPDPFSDKQALELADEAMNYGDDDTQEVLEERQAVVRLAQEMKQYILDGGHANDFLMKQMERQDKESEMMREVKKNIYELCKNGDVELAQQALDKYNAYLHEKGLPAVQPDVKMMHYLKKGKKK